MDAFYEVRISDQYLYGDTTGPGHETDVITVDSNREDRTAHLTFAARQFNVKFQLLRPIQMMRELLAFYHCCYGTGLGFRFKDWNDYTSTDTGTLDPLGVSPVDQALVTDVDGNVRLAKDYNGRTRLITKPVIGTVRIAVDGVEVFGFTLDTATGIVTGVPSGDRTSGFEFDVPVRFNGPFSPYIQDYDLLATNEVALLELRPDGDL